MEVVKESKKEIDKISKALKAGKVIVCPTDTVYGFLALASDKKAVDRIFKIKKRLKANPLPLFAKDIQMAKELAEINKDQAVFLKKNWPGKVTVVLNRKKGIKLFGQDKKTIALRIPKYKFLISILKKVNQPLVQTSVNISGEPTISKIKEVIQTFENSKNKPDLIIDGGSPTRGKPSKIVNLIDNKIKVLRK